MGTRTPWLWIGMVLVAGLLAVGLTLRRRDGRVAQRPPSCAQRLRQLHQAVRMYVDDWEGSLPMPDQWQDQIRPNVQDARAFQCPAAAPGGGYAWNSALQSAPMELMGGPEPCPLLFDSSNMEPNAADELTSFAPRHSGKGNVLYLDGHLSAEAAAPRPAPKPAR